MAPSPTSNNTTKRRKLQQAEHAASANEENPNEENPNEENLNEENLNEENLNEENLNEDYSDDDSERDDSEGVVIQHQIERHDSDGDDSERDNSNGDVIEYAMERHDSNWNHPSCSIERHGSNGDDSERDDSSLEDSRNCGECDSDDDTVHCYDDPDPDEDPDCETLVSYDASEFLRQPTHNKKGGCCKLDLTDAREEIMDKCLAQLLSDICLLENLTHLIPWIPKTAPQADDDIKLPKNLKSLTIKCTPQSSTVGVQRPLEGISELDGLTTLSINRAKITSLPASITRLKNLQRLQLYETKKIEKLPEIIVDLVGLIQLHMIGTRIASLPASIGQLKNLECLAIAGNCGFKLQKEIGDLPNLRILHLSSVGLQIHQQEVIWEMKQLEDLTLEVGDLEVPAHIRKLQNLKCLSLSLRSREDSVISELPDEIGDLTSLEMLCLKDLPIHSLPCSIGRLQNLKDILLPKTISKLPDEIGDLTGLEFLCLDVSTIDSLPHSIGRLQNLKALTLPKTISELPDEIGDLTGLEQLTLHISKIESLPRSIGRLQNLRVLTLPETISELPEELGDLIGLEKINLKDLKIESLPRSIGRLQNLKELTLPKTVLEFPDEIGDLISLKKLVVGDPETGALSMIESLPPSVGQLRNLTLLILKSKKLSALPEEIGELMNLQELCLDGGGVLKSLPRSIGRLRNLQNFQLCCLHDSFEMPEEIGELDSLESLHLEEVRITSSNFPWKLANLQNLSIVSCELPELTTFDKMIDFSLKLAHCLPVLGCFYQDKYECQHGSHNATSKQKQTVDHQFACNRARYRTGFGIVSKNSVEKIPNIWPHLLNNAISAFDDYNFEQVGDDKRQDFGIGGQPDAIYQLLLLGRESFVGVLVAQNSIPNSQGKNAELP